MDEEGLVWLTLDGSWAVARHDPRGGRTLVWPLEPPRAGPHDSLYGLSRAPDGTLWTASQAHLHKVNPATGDVSSHAFGRENAISGGVLALDDAVFAALPGANAIARLDRATDRLTFVAASGEFGPLEMILAPDGGVFLTATYANKIARLDPETLTVTPAPRAVAQAPTGLAWDGQRLWLGEHGASAVVAVDPATGNTTRYPTAPSPYFPQSGPSGVAIAPDGAVWFVEHFADRVARLDPRNGTLVEYEVPSAPGTNAQHLALAPDGRAWVAETSKARLAWVEFGGEAPRFALPASAQVAQGAEASVPLAHEGDLVANSGVAGLHASIEDGALRLRADADLAPGEHLVVVSERVDDETWVGAYVPVTVAEATSSPTPGAPPLGAFLVAALAALGLRRARR